MRKHPPFSLLGLALGNNELINKYICNQCHLEEIMFVSLAIEDNINTVPSPKRRGEGTVLLSFTAACRELPVHQLYLLDQDLPGNILLANQ